MKLFFPAIFLCISHILALFFTNICVISPVLFLFNDIGAKHQHRSVLAKPYDILISEIMANPNGAAGLPPQEYFELYNRSLNPVPLSGWKYNDYVFKTDQVIQPGEYVIICRLIDTEAFRPHGKVITLPVWPPLTNTGASLTLISPEGIVVDDVNYADTWYRDAQKRDGGWSLERINPDAFCLGPDNWIASRHEDGGTPGQVNTAYDENTGSTKAIIGFELIDNQQVRLTFSVSLDSAIAAVPSHYFIGNGVGNPQIAEVVDSRTVLLTFHEPFPPGRGYELLGQNLADCIGDWFTASYSFFLPESLSKGDLLISEILPNPQDGGVEFIEIYNNSTKTLDIQPLLIGSINSSGKLTSRSTGNSQLLISPGEYRVFATNPEIVRQQYHCPYPMAFIKMETMPVFNNNDGIVLLLYHDETIDSLHYEQTTTGVALERSHFSGVENSSGNFYPAAASAGYATPGYKNSQMIPDEPQENISLLSKTFSPDNDGFEDQLKLIFSLPENGYLANADIYNDRGLLIKRLMRNQSIATEGTISWDGISDVNALAAPGIYIIHIEFYHPKGIHKNFRKGFVLAKRF